MTTPKKGELPPEVLDRLIESIITPAQARRVWMEGQWWDNIPFDGTPGGDLSYKKKDDDND